jgi:hypothetical protein
MGSLCLPPVLAHEFSVLQHVPFHRTFQFIPVCSRLQVEL